MRRALKFCLLLLTVFVAVVFLVFTADYFDWQNWRNDILNRGAWFGQSIKQLKAYFTHSDIWNYMATGVFVSLCLLIFIGNDYLLEKVFKTRSKKRGFFWGGIVWFAQKTSVFILLFLEFLLLSNAMVIYRSTGQIHENINDLHTAPVLVLGTNKRLSDGGENAYYYQRIDAADQLYKKGKASSFVLSGDNHVADYNEPAFMRADLIKRNVPENMIKLDFAGFRTLDSVVRLKGHFGYEKVIIVSQRFHLQRAVALARFYGIDAQGYPAEGKMTFDMWRRELLAKPKALLDIFIFNTQPKYGQSEGRRAFAWSGRNDLMTLIGTVILTTISFWAAFSYSFRYL